MSRFDELLALLREPGEDGVPETIYDDLSGEYASLTDSSGAKVAQLEEQLQAQIEENSRLKAMNYDLLMSAPSDDADEPADDPIEDDEPAGIESLFESEDD